MIDFRYHLVSIVAVFLALTVGLVLGTTMLQDPLLNTLQSETADLRSQSEELRAERDAADQVNAGADRMAEAVSDDTLAGLLTGLGVVVVSAPGADTETADALAGRVEQAGGEVVGRVQISDAFLDGGNATFVDELALQITQDPQDLSGSPHEKAGAEIGRALAAAEEDPSGEGGSDDEEASPSESPSARAGEGGDGGHDPAAVLEAFTEGGLITVEGDPAESSDAVVVLAPSGGSSPEGQDPQTANAVLNTITTALHQEVGATVVAGDGPSARGEGMLAQARAAEAAFATVDVASRPMGEVITVLALAENLKEAGGAYGIGEGVAGFLPDPLPEPREASEDSEDSSDASPEPTGSDGASDAGGGTDEVRRTVRDGE
ncbi:copper transporter [Nocardiopsis dassonvillei]|uniref:copper transporter n=1 Tax=Nocardiopsis dassonvillei TaxID=2014 RepID=UPI00102AC81F|nr:copper transporter [Nocardiopsis dassonvillei]MCP3013421.1 copper transporter [Nocardiopsis dassonvillei]